MEITAKQLTNGLHSVGTTNLKNEVKSESKPIRKKKKLILNIRLPANVKNQQKAIQMLGGPAAIYKAAKRLS